MYFFVVAEIRKYPMAKITIISFHILCLNMKRNLFSIIQNYELEKKSQKFHETTC